MSTTRDPASGKKVQAVFVPKHVQGSWSGEISQSSYVKMTQVLDTDMDALRGDEQLAETRDHNAMMVVAAVPKESLTGKSVVQAEQEAANRKRLQAEALAAEQQKKEMDVPQKKKSLALSWDADEERCWLNYSKKNVSVTLYMALCKGR